MKRWILGTAFALLATNALADPAHNWTGFYMGADGGAIIGDSHLSVPNGAFANPDSSSFVYGGHLGYRQQFAPNWVAGIEGLLWGTAGYDSLTHYVGASNNARIDLKDGYAALGTLGFTVDPQVLIYGAAGWSNLHFHGCTTPAGSSACASGAAFSDNQSAFTWGGGVAFLVTQNLVMRFQYLHADYGSNTYSTPAIAVGHTTTAGVNTDMFTAGLSWKFGSN